MLVKRRAFVPQVVRAHDRGVAARVAAAEPAALEYRDVADDVLLRHVVGGSEPCPTAADDDDIVGGLRLGRAPVRRPVCMAAQRLAQEGERREALHGRWRRSAAEARASTLKSAFSTTPYTSRAWASVTRPCMASRCTSSSSRWYGSP